MDELAPIDPPPVVTEKSDLSVLLDNQTDLPEEVVTAAVEDYFIETGINGRGGSSVFQSYATNAEGNLFARGKFSTPNSISDEIKLARSLVERDDDIAPATDFMVAAAFSDGMENHHEDERTLNYFNKICRHCNMDHVLKEMYREYLIAGQVTTVSLFTREQMEFRPDETKRLFKETVAAPLIGVLPSERIRVIGNDIFGNAELAYDPCDDWRLTTWLEEFFNETTTPGRKAEMAREDRVAAAMFTGKIEVPFGLHEDGGKLFYRLNPRMCHRSTAPKGTNKYPTPFLTRNFALIEAKRLLNLLDFALLQGGMSFIVVAKKGTDALPATGPELQNLRRMIAHSSSTGVMVGDHRLNFEIITPDLSGLLNKDKRTLIARKLTHALMRITEPSDDAGDEAQKSANEQIPRVIESDRRVIKRHIENYIYEEAVERNRVFRRGSATLWFPKIVLQGSNYFSDYVLKLRDRGDIPRKWAVNAAGFDYEAGLAERQREIERGDDEVLMPAAVPFSNDGQPQDNNDGRPPGSSPNNGRPGARLGNGPDPAQPRRTVTRNAGETVRAIWDEAIERTVRIGEQTAGLLEQYPERTIGRVSKFERDALEVSEVTQVGPLLAVPVNPEYEVRDIRAVRLAPGLTMLVGRRKDKAVVAKAICFRSPEYDINKGEELAQEWGFHIPVRKPDPEPEPESVD